MCTSEEEGKVYGLKRHIDKGDMAQSKPKLLQYYIRDSVVPFEEDMYHEFKGHRNLSVEELPPWTKETNKDRASRRAVSRY